MDPSVIFTSVKLFDGEIVNRYNYLIQPNQSITISTGLKIKAAAPILVISKHENLNYAYFLLATSYYEQIIDEKKDLQALLKAKENFL